MKNSASVTSRCVRSLVVLLSAAAMVSPSLGAASSSAGPEQKTHVLFMGTSFSLEQNKTLYPVVDVTGDAFVIRVDGKEVRVPMSTGAAKIKTTPTLKLTESSARVSNLKTERAYTRENDPSVALQRGLNAAALQYGDSQFASNQANAALHTGDAAEAVANSRPVTGGPAKGQTLDSQVRQQNNLAALQGMRTGAGSQYRVLGTDAEGFDALEVNFEVSAERPLGRPFVVMIATYHPSNAPEGQVANWIYARALKPIGPTPTAVRIEQGGFPPGFEVRDFQLHLYDQGEEIATDVAPKRLALTRDEAFQYVMLQYLKAHKNASLSASPALGKLPGDLPAKMAAGQYKETYYVKVTPDGKAVQVFRDASCRERVDDPYLANVLRDFRFNPALEKGKPVEGVAALNFGTLSM